jgi:hypothetical protein
VALRGVIGAGVVGRELMKFGRPRGFSLFGVDVIVVAMIFGKDTAAFDAMLLKNES